jgi:hypothetical protein
MAQINPEVEVVFTLRGIGQRDSERIAEMAKGQGCLGNGERIAQK